VNKNNSGNLFASYFSHRKATKKPNPFNNNMEIYDEDDVQP
jgi:hypothetical protein